MRTMRDYLFMTWLINNCDNWMAILIGLFVFSIVVGVVLGVVAGAIERRNQRIRRERDRQRAEYLRSHVTF